MYSISKDSLLDVSDEGAIVQVNDEFYGLSMTAYEIINLVVETQSIADTAARLASSYDVDANELEEDVRKVLADCIEKGIIVEG